MATNIGDPVMVARQPGGGPATTITTAPGPVGRMQIGRLDRQADPPPRQTPPPTVGRDSSNIDKAHGLQFPDTL
ncbi:hypothetical protein [Nocardia grenadensis]|uniref:hypothetical protein n=1 Tax=Nocardia grenadensis TaxID=931537 RepID=UPI003D757EE8